MRVYLKNLRSGTLSLLDGTLRLQPAGTPGDKRLLPPVAVQHPDVQKAVAKNYAALVHEAVEVSTKTEVRVPDVAPTPETVVECTVPAQEVSLEVAAETLSTTKEPEGTPDDEAVTDAPMSLEDFASLAVAQQRSYLKKLRVPKADGATNLERYSSFLLAR